MPYFTGMLIYAYCQQCERVTSHYVLSPRGDAVCREH